MTDVDKSTFDLVVLGGGTAGMSSARTALRLKRSVAMIQDGPVGGDCTFTGCVPSKSLIESAHRGLSFGESMIFVQKTIAKIAATETAEVLISEGVSVIRGRGVFSSRNALLVAGRSVSFRHAVIATGTHPSLPPIPGLKDVAFLTNETFFDLRDPPGALGIIGGGPIGCELAQATAELGVDVTILEVAPRLLVREEPEASAVIERALSESGVEVRVGVEILSVATAPDSTFAVALGSGEVLQFTHLLVATGRGANTDDLGLQNTKVRLDKRGFVTVNKNLRSTDANIFAAGDVVGNLAFTHVADEMGRIAARNALIRIAKSSFDPSQIPWVTFTRPEVARVGILESEASGSFKMAYVPMTDSDRAITADSTLGFVKLIAGPKRVIGHLGGGRVVGATIVAERAGEMIHEVALACRSRLFVARLAQTVHAYPTWSTVIRQAAAQFFFEVEGRKAYRVDSPPGEPTTQKTLA